MVDVIGDGYDAVVRTGEMDDSDSSAAGWARSAASWWRRRYLRQHGEPRKAADLQRHACLHYCYPSTGRLERWPLKTRPRRRRPNCR